MLYCSEFEERFVPPALRILIPVPLRIGGYGALLMHALESEALRRGITRVDLSASLPSKGLYDGLGYTAECEEYIPVGNGRRLDYYAMAKTLDEGR